MRLMRIQFSGGVAAVALVSIAVLSAFQVGRKPEEEFAGIVKAYLGVSASTDWAGLEKLPGIKWVPLPPRSLEHCLPDGGCYTRQGMAAIGGRNLAVVATGARTIAANLYLRNAAAPLGEEAVLAAVKQAGLITELARCPVAGGAGSTNWYRVKGVKLSPGFLSIQVVRGARPSEGFTVSRSEELPQLQPNQLALYSEQCGAGAGRKPVSTVKPHEQLAQTIVSLLGQAAGPALYDWKALAGLPAEMTWNPGPKPGSPSPNDPNPMQQTGAATYAGRKFSLLANGTATQVKTITLEELGMHPRGEHMLGVVYEKGIAVRLVRCGPVYTESTNNWYSLTSAKTRPAMIRQSIRYDGNQVQDSYELQLDGSLPARDPRDRDPGVNDCR
jgi:hypothetical protein